MFRVSMARWEAVQDVRMSAYSRLWHSLSIVLLSTASQWHSYGYTRSRLVMRTRHRGHSFNPPWRPQSTQRQRCPHGIRTRLRGWSKHTQHVASSTLPGEGGTLF